MAAASTPDPVKEASLPKDDKAKKMDVADDEEEEEEVGGWGSLGLIFMSSSLCLGVCQQWFGSFGEQSTAPQSAPRWI